MKEQNIIIEQYISVKLNVDEPILLLGYADSGKRLKYEIVEGYEHAKIVDEIELFGISKGVIKLKASVDSDEEYNYAENIQEIEIKEADYYEKLGAILNKKNKVDSDVNDLTEISKIPTAQVKELSFNVLESVVEVKINGVLYTIDQKNIALKFINSSTIFWKENIEKELLKLEEMKSEL